MKKTALLCAAALVAFGVSAQANEAVGATQVIITIPVVAGENCIGISVAREDADDNVADALGLADATPLHDPGETRADAVSATPGVAFFYYASADGTLYQKGIESSSATITVPAQTLTLLASPKAEAWKLSDVTGLETDSYKMPTAKANWVYVWDTEAQGYKKYWYDSAKSAWKLYGSNELLTGNNVPTVGAGQGVYVKLGVAKTLSFPQ